MNLPKYAFAADGDDQPWGVVRMRNPALFAEFERQNEFGLVGQFQPWLWPPDAMAFTTEAKFHRILTRMWRIFERETEELGDVALYRFSLDRPLPPWLVLDWGPSDFTGVLDTDRGLLWIVGENVGELTAALEWRMHPSHPARHDWPQCHRDVSSFWREFLEKTGEDFAA